MEFREIRKYIDCSIARLVKRKRSIDRDIVKGEKMWENKCVSTTRAARLLDDNSKKVE